MCVCVCVCVCARTAAAVGVCGAARLRENAGGLLWAHLVCIIEWESANDCVQQVAKHPDDNCDVERLLRVSAASGARSHE
jgi:hypothetical protein